MTVKIKKSDDINTSLKKEASLNKVKKLNPIKFCGTIKLNESPMKIQSKLRNEW